MEASVRASCGPVEEETVSAYLGVVVPMPTLIPESKVTVPPVVPIMTCSLPVVVSILRKGAAVLDVAIDHAYGVLFKIVEVAAIG
jgi:hypothetical protein